MFSTAIISDPVYAEHLTGNSHPESPQRYVRIVEALTQAGLKNSQNSLAPRMAEEREILTCHSKKYYQTVQQEILAIEKLRILDGSFSLSTGDVQICPNSWEAALKAVGGVLVGVDAVMQGMVQNAFCVVRPPGHHATPSAGMGFCIFNNVAIGVRYLQKKYGISKVLVVDWDVHHGNGTQDIFEEDPSVFYFSTHQAYLYPGTGSREERGKGRGFGTTLNYPIIASPQSRLDVLKAFSVDLKEVAERFRPEFVFISAGFDAHEADPLGGFNLTDKDFGELTKLVKAIASQYAEGRLVSVLEGGYNLDALATASVAHVKALISNKKKE